MISPTTLPQADWQPLELLRCRFEANVDALSTRNGPLANRLRSLSPSGSYRFSVANDAMALARFDGGHLRLIPPAVDPAAADQVARQMFGGSQCTQPVAVVGLSHGWLWDRLCRLPCHCAPMPGHRHPLYFLAGEVERFWVLLHVHDWRQMLTDERVGLFVGEDAVDQMERSLVENPHRPPPRLAVTLEPALWNGRGNLDAVLQRVNDRHSARLESLQAQLRSLYPDAPKQHLTGRLSAQRLRVLGVTSRYTTFLQYSMRDWLDAFASLGHECKLLIEQVDSECHGPIDMAEACASFQPDLIVLIDHFRDEFRGLPHNLPCVMWVQDQLPHIFTPAAGPRQKAFDYTIGYGRHECTNEFGYPKTRFMPAAIGVNERRFSAERLPADELATYACDVSFVSHASTPAEVLIQAEIDRAPTPEYKRFLSTAFERLRAVYTAGGSVTEVAILRKMLENTADALGLRVSGFEQFMTFWSQKLNSALFRHQTLNWLAELDLNIHLYGKGWENHPRFARFARGVADNERQLRAVYQASTINLQVMPFGAAHQRVFDGLAAGGFFLMRHTTGDELERIYQRLWTWCQEKHVTSADQLWSAADDEQSRAMLDQIAKLTGVDINLHRRRFFAGLCEAAEGGFTRGASTLWPEYDRVGFSTRDELQSLVKHFLEHEDERREIATSMRQRMLDVNSYAAISRRTLDFIRADLSRVE